MRSDVNIKDDALWEYLRCMTNSLMEDCMKENAKIASDWKDNWIKTLCIGGTRDDLTN